MQELTEHTNTVIKQKDTSFSPYLDFQFLRQEGLRHIGELSGKIWTDHNTHDPGITILEVLCYALMDLGYRTALPIEDLLAKANPHEPEYNFLTPDEALTCNPTSILDYRKMLLDVPGVRNAWLEPFELDYTQFKSEEAINNYLETLTKAGLPLPLWLNVTNEGNDYKYDLNCKRTTNPNAKDKPHPIGLNGLYRIYIELEHYNLDETAIIQQAQVVLSRHRNLCEDFIDITILEPQAVGICADIELTTGADAAQVYEAVLRAVQQFVSPQINYYTLQGLLDKGKSIEAIFAGRPLSEKSHGFIDTEELENLPRRTALYTSDLYRVLLAIAGVKAVRNLHFTPKDAAQKSNWQFALKADGAPYFDIAQTCIELSGSVGTLQIDTNKIHQTIFKPRKSLLDAAELDLSIPQGTYHADLGDYRSVQDDFPNVYGIGENNLPDSATRLRKTQALQLKGYLLLYDQLLANYLGKLTQLRPLFSMQQESQRPKTERHTYFHQPLQAVSELPALLQSHLDAAAGMLAGSVVASTINMAELSKTVALLNTNPRLVITVSNNCDPKKGILSPYNYETQQRRELFLEQARRDFTQENYTIQIYQDRNGYFFILCTENLPDLAFLSFQRFTTYGAAQAAANQAAFLATIAGNYQLDHYTLQESTEPQYIFNLIYRPSAYQNYLQDLLEDQTAYTARREKLLDHLLARFAENFTDYALLAYSAGAPPPDHAARAVEDKSRFLQHYADLSRNRGRAYDYLQPAWNTENVSGFEKRVSMLAGMNNWTRRNLCNFEIVESFRMQLKDPEGNLLFTNNASYETEKELREAANMILDQLRDIDSYKNLALSLPGFSTLVMQRMFALAPAEKNVIVSKYHYYLQLKNTADVIIKTSKVKDYDSPEAVLATVPTFIATIHEQTTPPTAEAPPLFDLRILNTEPICYLNMAALSRSIEQLITYKWHIYNELGEPTAQSQTTFLFEAEAMTDFAANAPFEKYITRDQLAWHWEIVPLDGFKMRSARLYADQRRAREDWQNIKQLGKTDSNYRIQTTGEAASYHLELVNEKNAVVAISDSIASESLAPQDFIAACRKIFSTRQDNIKFKRLKDTYGFQILDTTGESLLLSYCLYPDVETAFRQLEEAFLIGKEKEHYVPTGSVGNPIYRFLLRHPQTELFLGISAVQPRFETAEERDTALENLLGYLHTARIPVAIAEEPRRYRWTLLDQAEVVLQSDYVHFSPGEAVAAFEGTVVQAAEQQAYAVLQSQLYRVEIAKEPALYRFLYFTTAADGQAQCLLQSSIEFKEPELAQTAYTDFVKRFPGLQLKTPGTRSKKTTLELLQNGRTPIATGDAADAEPISKLQTYLQQIYSGNPEQRTDFIKAMIEGGGARKNYRIVQKNKPLAIHPEPFATEDAARAGRKAICTVQPPLLELCKQNHLICQAGNPNKFHYLLKIQDAEGKEHTLLISYQGYDTPEEAETAYQKNWLSLLELASEAENYGTNHPIFEPETETYSKQSEPNCVTSTTTLAVLPTGVPKADVVRWAKQFPIRSKKVKIGSQPERTVYYFRLLQSTESEKILWQSADDYDTLEAALEAYRLFVMILRNPSSCYVWCEQGQYRVGAFEILAESGEFSSDDQAWNAVQDFVKAAETDTAYEPFPDGNCFRFKIMTGDTELAANPNCYETRTDVTKAMQRLRDCINDEGMHLVEHLLLRPQENQVGCDCLLPVCPDLDCQLTWRETTDPTDPCAKDNVADLSYIPGADPYSFWATIVLPAWTKRFRNTETRRFFEQMLYLEAPALVGLNILWLNPREMCAFEERYKNFLEWRCDPFAEQYCRTETSSSPLCGLVQEIRTLESTVVNPAADESDKDCDCLKPAEQSEKTPNNLFWNNCTTLSEEVPEKPIPIEEGIKENPDAIRLAMQVRAAAYRTNIENTFSEAERLENESYKQTTFFLTNPPSIKSYESLVDQIVKNPLADKQNPNKDQYRILLYNATWRLLDHLVQNNQLAVAKDEMQSLKPIIKTLQKQGLNVNTVIQDWNAVHLESLFGKQKVDDYIQFLKGK